MLRRKRLWSLVNAFVKPIKPGEDEDLVELSIVALGKYWGRLVGMYGGDDLAGGWCATTYKDAVGSLSSSLGSGLKQGLPIVSLPEVVNAVRAKLAEDRTLWPDAPKQSGGQPGEVEAS